MRPTQAALLGAVFLYAGILTDAQRVRSQGNARVINGHQFPFEVIYPTTLPAAAPIFGSTAVVTITSSSFVANATSIPSSNASIHISSSTTSRSSTAASSSSFVSSHGASLLTSSLSATQTTSETTTPSTTGIERRTAIAACLNDVEVSCYNLAANCIDSVNGGNQNTIWSIPSCVAAATCYGVGDLISSVSCQTGFSLEDLQQGNLLYDIYADIVGSCAWDPNGCPITEQNYVDFFYSTLSDINTGGWPSSVNVVTGYWGPILSWAATGTTIPYTNFNDWLHYSSFPTVPPPVTTTPPVVYTQVPWNPNSVPSAGAVSQTFVRSETTTVIAIPTVTVTITIAGATITVAPGGTPVGGIVPTDVTQPDAVLPTFNWNPIPPATASSVTFVSGTWTSIVAAPTVTDDPVTVNGPPDDGDDDDSNDSWLLLLGLLGLFFLGSIPSTVSVVGAATPAPAPPPDWTSPDGWIPPPPPPGSSPDPDDDDGDDDDDDDSDVCTFRTIPDYTLPYDGDGPEELDRRQLDLGQYQNNTKTTHRLFKRSTRWIVLGSCSDMKYSFTDFNMGATDWFTVNPPFGPAVPSSNTNIQVTGGATHVVFDGKVKEHVFEFRFIRDFIEDQFQMQADCQWLTDNLWNAPQPDGRATYLHLKDAIDHVDNCVWVDDVINKAKSSVTNNHHLNAPALRNVIDGLNTLNPNPTGDQVETYIRASGMLGQYFTQAAALRITAARVQAILAVITPGSAIYPPLDERFNDFFRNLMSQYPQRITSRATRVFDYYHDRMNDLLQTAILNNPPGNPVPTVPACWPVYHDAGIRNRLNTAGMTWQNHVPASIYHPPCNTAGESRDLILYYDPVTGVPVTLVGTSFRVVATGERHFGLGRPPPSLSVFWNVNLQGLYGNTCTGVHWMMIAAVNIAPNPNNRLGTWDQDCIAGAGPGLSDLHPIDDNGNRMTCLINNFNDGTNTFAIDCGASQNDIQACITHMNNQDGRPNAYTSTPFLRLA